MASEVKDLAASIASGELVDDSVDMLPDGSLQWLRHKLPKSGGDLYLPADLRPGLIDHMAAIALRPPKVWPLLGKRGLHAGVTFSNGLANKIFNGDCDPYASAILPLQANIALHVGLERTDQVIGGWQALAPEQLGAIIRPRGI